MGDSGIGFSNRVLLLAYKGESLVGCVSSTYSPPWTPEGCGHWGLLVVHTAHQGKGVAKALVFAAERRVAGACERIQIEYDHHGDEYGDRLQAWYEDKLGFEVESGGRSRRGGSFRRCRKTIPALERAIGRWQRMRQINAYLTGEIERAEAREAKRAAKRQASEVDEEEDEEGSEGEGEDMPLCGRRVVIHGTSRGDLNGCSGVAEGFDAASGRYVVKMDGKTGKKLLKIKPTNLEEEEEEETEGECPDVD